MRLIRRNPGTCWFILVIIVSFWLGMTAPTWPEPIARTVMQCWMLTVIWWTTTLNVKWIEGRMKKHKKAPG